VERTTDRDYCPLVAQDRLRDSCRNYSDAVLARSDTLDSRDVRVTDISFEFDRLVCIERLYLAVCNPTRADDHKKTLGCPVFSDHLRFRIRRVHFKPPRQMKPET
jgi:hypothetical protein